MFKISFLSKKSDIGLAPGTRVFVGDQKMEVPKITIMDFNSEDVEEKEIEETKGLANFKESDNLSWINIDGVHDADLMEKIGSEFELDTLVQEDIMNTTHRPKMEEHEDFIFVVMPMMWLDEKAGQRYGEQLSLIIHKKCIITFQERTGDVFEPLRDRIRKRKGSRVRTLGIDYLGYCIIDVVIDHYIHLIDILGAQIEDLEVEVLEELDEKILNKINEFKRDVSYIRKQIRPVREFVMFLSKLDSEMIQPGTKPFIKDLSDHIQNAYDNVEAHREMLTDYLNLYHTRAATKLSDIMRVLTIFSAIFIPLTFIAGIYGTNFQYFPEIHWKYAYPLFWLVIVSVTIGMFIFFKRKKWL